MKETDRKRLDLLQPLTPELWKQAIALGPVEDTVVIVGLDDDHNARVLFDSLGLQPTPGEATAIVMDRDQAKATFAPFDGELAELLENPTPMHATAVVLAYGGWSICRLGCSVDDDVTRLTTSDAVRGPRPDVVLRIFAHDARSSGNPHGACVEAKVATRARKHRGHGPNPNREDSSMSEYMTVQALKQELIETDAPEICIAACDKALAGDELARASCLGLIRYWEDLDLVDDARASDDPTVVSLVTALDAIRTPPADVDPADDDQVRAWVQTVDLDRLNEIRDRLRAVVRPG